MSDEKKVYFVLNSLVGGGAESVAILILKYLDKKRFMPKVILFNKKGEFVQDLPSEIEIEDYEKQNKLDFFKIIFRLRKEIKERKPSTIISFLQYANVVLVLSCIGLKNKPRIVLTEHTDPRMYLPHDKFSLIKNLLMRFTYRKSDKIIAVSKGIKDALTDHFGIEKDKVEVIYNPIDIKLTRALKEEMVEHQFFCQNNEVIVSVGRLTKQKNFGLLIKAFALVRKEVPAYLLILGQGELRNDLQNLTKELGIDKYVDFAGFKKNPFSWMKKSDVFVLSSDWEGFGNVIIESMACGVPVISTDCPSGPNEIISNGVNGILVPCNNIERLSEAMLLVLKDRDVCERLSKAAKERALDFDVGRIVPRYENALCPDNNLCDYP